MAKYKEFEITDNPDASSKQERIEEEQQMPKYMSQIDIKEERQVELVTEIFDELDEIKKERDDEKLEEKWDDLDAQYEGECGEGEEGDNERIFNFHVPTTKIKIDKASARASDALLKAEPIFAVSARPEAPEHAPIAEKQEDYLDYKVDNVIPFRRELAKVLHSAFVKGVGILKLEHVVKIEKRRREEVYEGSLEPIVDPRTGRQAVDQNGQLLLRNEAAERFVRNFPGAQQDYPKYIEKLMKGEKVDIVVEYKEKLYDDPMPKFVDLKNFYVRKCTDGYLGLKEARLTVERISLSYWELETLEKKGLFYDIDDLTYAQQEGATEKKRIDKYQYKYYNILECTYMCKPQGDEEDYIKCIFWVGEDTRKMIGKSYYSYYAMGSQYFPFYVKRKKDGFYQPGVAEDLSSVNITEDDILNFILEGAWIQNTVTPIIDDGSEVEKQFLENRFAHGVPIIKKTTEAQVDFLQRYMQPQNIPGLVALLQYVQKAGDDVSGLSSYTTGGESMIDPSAPAAKTLALLRESGINISDYLYNILESFNEVGAALLAMYYQICEEGRAHYQTSADRKGDQAFGFITRDEMITRTNIQSQAFSFAFDRMQEKQETIALYSILRKEPLVANNVEAVHFLLKSIVKSWSPKWKGSADKLLPSVQQLQAMQMQTAIQAVAMFIQMSNEQARLSGQPPQYDPKALQAMVNQMVGEIATPPSEEVQKERQKAAKEAQGG